MYFTILLLFLILFSTVDTVVHNGQREHVCELVHERLVPVRHSDVGDVGPLDVVAGDPRVLVVGPQPVLLGVVREPGLEDGVTGDLTEITATGHMSCQEVKG